MAIDRAEIREWLEANCPQDMREPAGDEDTCWGGRRWAFQSEAQKLWLERCAARGLTVPDLAQGIRRRGLCRARTRRS